MIGTVRREVKCLPLPDTKCGHCEQDNTLMARIYSKMFVLKVLPFAMGKEMMVECVGCKKAYTAEWDMPPHIWENANQVKQQARHPLYAYIGYALMGVAMFIAIVKQ